MKRCFLALALLVAIAGLAHAEFIIIRVNLGVPPEQPKDKNPNPMGVPNPNPMGMPIPPGGIGKVRPGPGGPKMEGPVKGGVPAVEPEPSTPLTIVAIAEYEKIAKSPANLRYYLVQKWNKKVGGQQLVTGLWNDDRVVQVRFLKYPTLDQQVKSKREEFNRNRDKKPADYLANAEWALTSGRLDEFKTYMDDLAKTDTKDARAVEVLKAYKQVTENLQKTPGRDDPAIAWRSRLDAKAARSEHYVMLYDAPSVNPPRDVTSRLDRLEKNYQQFFYWFAMRGRVLPMPDRKLVAFLVDTPNDFKAYHAAFDRQPLVADGFYARRDNLIVLSTHRVDEQSVILDAHLKEFFKNGWNEEALLRGERPRGKEVDEIDYAQTMAFVQRLLREESEAATISHEGTCQLLAATGLLPRTVVAPEWVQYGLPSVWHTAKFDPILRTGAFWHGFGTPDWTHLVHFKALEAAKELPNAQQALEMVLTDQDFRRARLNRDAEQMLRARTMAWALCYFLVSRHLDSLQRYSQELSALPRDLELDDAVTILCFARAFKLTDANGQIDQAKFRNFANEWYKFIEITPAPMRDSLDEAQKALKELKEAKEKGPAKQ